MKNETKAFLICIPIFLAIIAFILGMIFYPLIVFFVSLGLLTMIIITVVYRAALEVLNDGK